MTIAKISFHCILKVKTQAKNLYINNDNGNDNNNIDDNNFTFDSIFPRTLATNFRTVKHQNIITSLSSFLEFISYIKPIFGRYHLHNVHEQFCGQHFLIPGLKAFKVITFFKGAI